MACKMNVFVFVVGDEELDSGRCYGCWGSGRVKVNPFWYHGRPTAGGRGRGREAPGNKGVHERVMGRMTI